MGFRQISIPWLIFLKAVVFRKVNVHHPGIPLTGKWWFPHTQVSPLLGSMRSFTEVSS